MIAVNEINVRVSGRTEEHHIARRAADGSVCGGIVGTQVGFDFDDASGEKFAALAAYENFAKQVRAD